jgi:hypothetical protein
MNIISKEKKEIRWLGLPTNSVQEAYTLESDKVPVVTHNYFSHMSFLLIIRKIISVFQIRVGYLQNADPPIC